MNRTIIALGIVVLLLMVGGVAYYFTRTAAQPVVTNPSSVLSFADCERAGYPIMESYPRQCKTPDGRTYAEEIQQKPTYVNASENNIQVRNPFPGAVTGKQVTVSGTARGTWYFEASFPVEIKDMNGVTIASGPAQAQGDWMTENFVPFTITLTVPNAYIGPATLILHKDNPSGMPENDASVSMPITIEY
jgi:hypothetical protein